MGDRAAAFEKIFQLSPAHAIQHPFFRDAALARLGNSPAHKVEFPYGMRVWVDAEHAAELQRLAVPAPVKIESPRICIYLDGNVVGGAGGEHLSTSTSYPLR